MFHIHTDGHIHIYRRPYSYIQMAIFIHTDGHIQTYRWSYSYIQIAIFIHRVDHIHTYRWSYSYTDGHIHTYRWSYPYTHKCLHLVSPYAFSHSQLIPNGVDADPNRCTLIVHMVLLFSSIIPANKLLDTFDE